MTPALLRAAVPARVFRRIATALEQLATPPMPADLPGHDQLREAREHHRYAAASPHIIAVAGRIDVIRIPR